MKKEELNFYLNLAEVEMMGLKNLALPPFTEEDLLELTVIRCSKADSLPVTSGSLSEMLLL